MGVNSLLATLVVPWRIRHTGEAGSKLDKARELGVAVLDEAGLRALLASGEAAAR